MGDSATGIKAIGRFSVQKILSFLCSYLEARNGRKIPFNIVLHAGTYEVSCDFEELARILLRTLQGLRKESATGQDVKIEIRNRRFFDKNGRNHYGVKAGAYVEFVLSASTPQETNEGRKDFYAKGGGAPLILRKIMEEIKMLGGAFIASADENETSYGLVVPAVNQRIEPNIQKVAHPDPRHMGTILVAEKDDNILSLIESGLKLKGYSVISTEDGKMALKTFERKKDDITLIFADVDLPHLTGTDLVLRANKLKPDIRVLLTSSVLVPESQEVIKNIEYSAYISKPFPLADLFSLIDCLLGA